MIMEVLVLGVLGFIASVGLEVASSVLGKEKDPRVEAVLDILPGIDCGVCENPSCAQHAEEIVNDPSVLYEKKCVVISDEDYEEIAEILGIDWPAEAESDEES